MELFTHVNQKFKSKNVYYMFHYYKYIDFKNIQNFSQLIEGNETNEIYFNELLNILIKNNIDIKLIKIFMN